MLWALFLGVLAVADECITDCSEDQKFGRSNASSLNLKTACGPAVLWPCGDERVNKFPLQVFNSDVQGLTCGSNNVLTIAQLDIGTGTYVNLCTVQGVCLNACHISPETNNSQVWCAEYPSGGQNPGNNLVRVDCPINPANLSTVTGTVCYFGKILDDPSRQIYAATFDLDGNYWWKTGVQRPKFDGSAFLPKFSQSDFAGFTGTTVRQGTVIFQPSDFPPIVTNDFNRVADLNAIERDIGQENKLYLINCDGVEVYIAQVDPIPSTQNPIILYMTGDVPQCAGGNGFYTNQFGVTKSCSTGAIARVAGAQWLFEGKVFCAYNNGVDGVIEVLLDTAQITGLTGTVPVARRSDSPFTPSNDGMNCLLADNPFTTTTTTTGGGGAGDPRIHTLDGEHYLLLNQGYHLNVEVKMFSAEDLPLVKGQLGLQHQDEKPNTSKVASLLQASGQKLRTDQEFETRKDWVDLGGSAAASTYLKEVDEEGTAVLKGCSEEEKNAAKEVCLKYLGSPSQSHGDNSFQQHAARRYDETLNDCIFDVCAGGGETAAELAAEILHAF